MKYKVISFATPDYSDEALGLLNSLATFNIPGNITTVKKRKSWTETTFYKLPFIAKQLRKHKCPLVWLDADARVLHYPKLFDELGEYEFAAGYIPKTGELLTNCMYLAYTPTVLGYLNAVYQMILSKPTLWDSEQKYMQWVLEDEGWSKKLKCYKLPFSYCKLEHWGFRPWHKRAWNGEAVILQRQASRWLNKVRKETYERKGIPAAVKEV